MKVRYLFLIIAIGTVLVIGGAVLQAKHNQEVWNNGYCECGGHWELKGATRVKNGATTKYYACEKCYEEIKIKA